MKKIIPNRILMAASIAATPPAPDIELFKNLTRKFVMI
jgi:hypothetical protein